MKQGARIRYKIELDVPDAGASQAAATALEELIDPPADAVSRFQAGNIWHVDAYYTDPPDVTAVGLGLAEILGTPIPPLTLADVPDENWVAISQAALPPVVAGRFTVHGSHDRNRIPSGPWAIEIDAGEAFGTAHHATTSGCLVALDRIARRRSASHVLDLGCGTGVLAIAASRLWPWATVQATDIDPEAVRVARENAKHNRAQRVAIRVADGVPRAGVAKRFDLVVANILAGPLIALSPAISRVLRPGADLILSGILNDQAAAVRAAYRAHGFHVAQHGRIAGWSTLVLQRTAERPAPPRQRRSRH